MKTWISKNNLSRSPQSALKMYYHSGKRPKLSSELSFSNRSKQHFLVRRLRSQLRSLSKLLTHEAMAEMNKA